MQTARYFSSMICDLLLAGIPRVAVHQLLGREPVAPPASCVQTLKKQRDRNYVVYSEIYAIFFLKFSRKSSNLGAGEGVIELSNLKSKKNSNPFPQQ